MKINLLVLFMCLFLQAARGQNIQTEEQLAAALLPQKLSEQKNAQLLISKAIIHQAGSQNTTSITQHNVSSDPNSAFISQIGSLNNALLNQQGQGNTFKAAQVGDMNHYTGEIGGSGNTLNILQKGTSNEINQNIEGRDLDYTLIQMGDGNKISQLETSPGSKSYKIVQEGNNMRITIEQSNWCLPPVVGKEK